MVLVSSFFGTRVGFERLPTALAQQLPSVACFAVQIHVQATMYGEPEYHGAYAANNSEASTGMHRSPSQCEYNYSPADACLSPRVLAVALAAQLEYLVLFGTGC